MFMSNRDKREAEIKSNIVDHLKECVQSLIQGPAGKGLLRLSSNCSPNPEILGHTENTNLLCSVLEAIFIHGLKDGLGEKLSAMFLGDLDRMPVPNFWSVIMVISHRDLMEQVSSLSFIMNDVGKAKAWIRLALNQGQLLSYISVLASDQRTLKEYYKSTALLRDLEKCDITLGVLNPLGGLTFNLATNSAILNTWTQSPLILSGTWIPANFEQSLGRPIMAATDVARSSTFFLHDDDDRSASMDVPQTPVDDQIFDLIIGSTPETNFTDEWLTNHDQIFFREEKQGKKEEIIVNLPEKNLNNDGIVVAPTDNYCDTSTTIGTDNGKIEADIIGREETNNVFDNDVQFLSEDVSYVPIRDPYESDGESLTRSTSMFADTDDYNALLSDYQSTEQNINLPDFLNLHQPENEVRNSQVSQVSSPEINDFEVLSLDLLSEEEMCEHMPYLAILQNEIGLDCQNYQCENCKVPIGIIHGKPRLCAYDGHHYCHECHRGDESLIPARILHNWDFKPRPVCKFHKRFLDAVSLNPIIDVRESNPRLYKHFAAISELHTLRRQLHFIQAYLFTCPRTTTKEGNRKEGKTSSLMTTEAGQELRKLLWPREHLYQHVHLYSVRDLADVHNGKLLPLVRGAVSKGVVHIKRCLSCCPRGFRCELCDDKDIIYPFELDATSTCAKCSGVFHKSCIIAKDCPKCERLCLRKLQVTEAF